MMGMDALDKPIVCMACSNKTTFGKLRAKDVLRCPKCDSDNFKFLNSEMESVPEYHGEICTIQ